MSLILEVDAEEMREYLDSNENKVVALEIPNAVNVSEAKCVDCDGNVDREEDLLSIALEAAAFVHNMACVAIDDEQDFRAKNVPEMVSELVVNLIEQGKLTTKSIETLRARSNEVEDDESN